MLSRFPVRLMLAMAAMTIAAGCDRVPLLAPSESIITVSSTTPSLAPGATTEITAFVIEQSGTPVHNGTLVRFTATLGQVNPVEVETRGGIAITTFTAGSSAGTATVRATSGAATGGDGDPPSNVVEIQIGAAAANTVALSASPSRVPSTGGTVTMTASVLDAAGNRLAGVPVTFSTTAGTLSAGSATTNSAGDAQVTLTTNREARVTARAADKTADFTVTVGSSATVGLSHTPAVPTAGQPVTLTVTPSIPTGGQAPRVVVQWGDGTQSDLGTVAAARATTHTYSSSGAFVVTAIATADGETSSSSTTITVNPPAPVSVTLVAAPASPNRCQSVTFTATVPTTETFSFFDWENPSNPTQPNVRTTGPQFTTFYSTVGSKQVKVTATTTDGRQGFAVIQINVVEPAMPPPPC
jgi:hypothetical protein